jgi:hypothetical protein
VNCRAPFNCEVEAEEVTTESIVTTLLGKVKVP